MWADEEALELDIQSSYDRGYAEGLKAGVEKGMEMALNNVMAAMSSEVARSPTPSERERVRLAMLGVS